MNSSMKLMCALILFISYKQSYSEVFEYPTLDSESTSDPMILDSLNGKLKGRCYTVPVTYSKEYTVTSDVFVWKGIPYAEPPVNEKRFMRPEPVKSWNNIRPATRFANRCEQPKNIFKFNNTEKLSEDCLFLNVFVKSNSIYLNRKL